VTVLVDQSSSIASAGLEASIREGQNLLVEAFAGERWRELYAVALKEGYRFLSFGDAMCVARAA